MSKFICCDDIRSQHHVRISYTGCLLCGILRRYEVRDKAMHELKALGNEQVEISTTVETQHQVTTDHGLGIQAAQQHEIHRQRG